MSTLQSRQYYTTLQEIECVKSNNPAIQAKLRSKALYPCTSLYEICIFSPAIFCFSYVNFLLFCQLDIFIMLSYKSGVPNCQTNQRRCFQPNYVSLSHRQHLNISSLIEKSSEIAIVSELFPFLPFSVLSVTWSCPISKGINFAHYAVICPRIDHLQRVHQLIHYFHDLLLIFA